MRVLQVNKFGTRSSGADIYFLEVGRRLAERGHEVAYLCMRPQDTPPEATVFEVEDIDFHAAGSAKQRAIAAGRVMWSRKAKAVMAEALETFQPDVVHLHNYAHQLSSSVLEPVQRKGVPSLMTVHDYKLICPAYTAVREGQACFRCSTGSVSPCISGRCLHGSLAWSGLAAAESVFVRAGGARRVPNRLVAPSSFMADRLQDSWLSDEAVTVAVVRNPIDVSTATSRPATNGTGIYVGRLSAEKGLDVLIRGSALAGVPITLVGEGSERSALEALVAELHAPVTFTGYQRGADLEDCWRGAAFFAMTPTWPENAPLALLEALVRGMPAVLTRVGGLAEVVGEYGGGHLIDANDVAATAAALRFAAAGSIPPPDALRLTHDLSWPSHLTALESHYSEVSRAN